MRIPEYIAADATGLSAERLSLVGGKAANLGELLRAGLPVPSLFCVTTDAYLAFVEANSLDAVIAAELAGANPDDIVDLTGRAARIRERFERGHIPDAVATVISQAYAAMADEDGGDPVVSVRSSATAEDLPGASFAGQQDTYLHIRGSAQVVAHVKRCWASLWTDRAISYRSRMGFGGADVALAVVVQKMFASEVSGVMFTGNPLTSNPGEMLINASWGLGEAVVSGRVNPDQYLVDRKANAIAGRVVQDKAVMTAPKPDFSGTLEAPVPDDRRRSQALGDEQILQLAEIGRRIEDHYGYPQDIEWGFADGRFAVLQSREITAADLDYQDGIEAFQSPGARADQYDDRWVWSRAWSDEIQTGSSTPWWYSYTNEISTRARNMMLEFTDTEEFLGFGKDHFRDIPMFRWYGARAYINTAVERERIRRFIPPFAREAAALFIFPEKEREEVAASSFNWPSFLTMLWDVHLKRPHLSLLENHKNAIQNLPRWKEYEEEVWSQVDMTTASARSMTKLQLDLRDETGFAQNVVMPFTIYLYFLPAAFKMLCRDWFDDTDGRIYGALSSGMSSKTAEENIALWHVAETIARNTALKAIALADKPLDAILTELRASERAAEFNERLDAFLRDYGHRGGAERDPFHPRYRHRPQNVVRALRSLLQTGLKESDHPGRKEERNAEIMRQTREQCLETLCQKELAFLRVPFFTWFFDLFQGWLYYRDFERFYNDKTMSRPRDWLTALAQRFREKGLLDNLEDIFFLSKEEVIMVDEGELDARQIDQRIRARRRVFDRYAHREPPKYIRGWTFFDDDQFDEATGDLRGLPASGGTVTGRARVCRTLEEISKVQKGDILVTVATEPGWTTVFAFAGGVVVETGGVISHAVMISREYGLPCVASLSRACERIPDGALITVDGGKGIVKIHDETAALSD